MRSGSGRRTFIVDVEIDGTGDSGASEEEPCRGNECGEKHCENGNGAVRLRRTSSAQGRDWGGFCGRSGSVVMGGGSAAMVD